MRRIDHEWAALRATQINLQAAADELASEIERLDRAIAALEPAALGEAGARVDINREDDEIEQKAKRLAGQSEALRQTNIMLESLILAGPQAG